MNEILTQLLIQCQQFEIPVSIFLIDIDYFKNINDEYGHMIGDAILEKIGECIKSMTRTEDFSCRFGGDEFLLAFQNMPEPQAKIKASNLLEKLACCPFRRKIRMFA
jgi:diguanylate cyclase (GGDEF)-like protein